MDYTGYYTKYGVFIARPTLIEKKEFIKRHWTEISIIAEYNWYPNPKKQVPGAVNAMIHFLGHKARKELGYKDSYATIDIVYKLQKIYDEDPAIFAPLRWPAYCQRVCY